MGKIVCRYERPSAYPYAKTIVILLYGAVRKYSCRHARTLLYFCLGTALLRVFASSSSRVDDGGSVSNSLRECLSPDVMLILTRSCGGEGHFHSQVSEVPLFSAACNHLSTPPLVHVSAPPAGLKYLEMQGVQVTRLS